MSFIWASWLTGYVFGFDLHHGTEHAGGHPRVAGARSVDEVIKQTPPEFRRGRRCEARPGAAVRVGGERELRHQQQAAGDVLHAQVHLAGVIREDPVGEQLAQ